MSEFKITGPGFYCQRDGRKAEVCAAMQGHWAVGLDARGLSENWSIWAVWSIDGEAVSFASDPRFDLIAPWTEPRRVKFAEERRSSMSEFKIEAPGFYRQRNGRKAEVEYGSPAEGWGGTDAHGYGRRWGPDGHALTTRAGRTRRGEGGEEYPIDLVAVWVD